MNDVSSIVTIFEHPAEKKRVVIYRYRGFYSYELEKWTDDPREMCWIPITQGSYSICDTEEIAINEAKGAIDRLRELLDKPESQ